MNYCNQVGTKVISYVPWRLHTYVHILILPLLLRSIQAAMR